MGGGHIERNRSTRNYLKLPMSGLYCHICHFICGNITRLLKLFRRARIADQSIFCQVAVFLVNQTFPL
jgi:hypothetical protein